MYIYISFILPVVSYISCDSTSDLPRNVQQKTTTAKGLLRDISSTAESIRINLNTQTIHHHPSIQARAEENEYKGFHLWSAPSRLTKLAKTFSKGFDPYFNKDFFEPFESRPRPVTLVAFRKKGFVPRHVIKHKTDTNAKLSEIAELQSPYNAVGAFWEDELDGR